MSSPNNNSKATRKLLKYKILLIIITIILIPLFINLLGKYLNLPWFEEKTEITLKLEGWITVGELGESDVPDLKLTYKDNPVKNALKVSWKIINTGSKGIPKFEKVPSLLYPRKLNVVEAKIFQKSPLLEVSKNLLIKPEDGTIEVTDIGIFNKKEFFVIDVYIMNMPDTIITAEYFTDWDFIAKSVDLKTRKDITFEPREEARVQDTTPIIIAIFFIAIYVVLIGFFLIFAIFQER